MMTLGHGGAMTIIPSVIGCAYHRRLKNKEQEMITAEQARELNPKGRIKEYEDFLEKKIRDAALVGEDSVIVREKPYSEWLLLETVIPDKVAREVVNKLRQNGFSVKYYFLESACRSYSGLKISWGKAD